MKLLMLFTLGMLLSGCFVVFNTGGSTTTVTLDNGSKIEANGQE